MKAVIVHTPGTNRIDLISSHASHEKWCVVRNRFYEMAYLIFDYFVPGRGVSTLCKFHFFRTICLGVGCYN